MRRKLLVPILVTVVVCLCIISTGFAGEKKGTEDRVKQVEKSKEGEEVKKEEKAKEEKPKKDSYVIGMIAKSSTNPVFLSARTGAEAAAKDLGKKHNIKITIDWRTPPTEDGQVQAQRLAQAVNEGVDAALLSCSDAGKVTGAINDAVGRGIPVMTFDSDAPDSKRFAFYGVDDIETGEKVMKELAAIMGNKGNVAILAGNQNAPNLRKRVEGVKKEAAKYPDIKIIGTFYHVETPQDAASEVIRVQNAYPEITGWAMVGGWPLFTKTLLNDLDPEKVKIVAVDALPAQLPYVEKGIAPVLLAQPTYMWGYVSVEKIIDKIVLNKEVPVINPMELVRVTKENLGEWSRQLKDWGFTDIPEEYLKKK
jgi:ribose transport system substrate-binding protein